jgi:hypothetical protein
MSQAPIIPPKPSDGNFVRLMPPTGFAAGVCCDVVDRGMHTNEKYGKTQHKISIHWLLEAKIPSGEWTHPHTGEKTTVPADLAGKPFMVSEWFTMSLHPDSNLRKLLRQWRGRDFTEAELGVFDLQNVVGVRCVLNIGHNQGRNGKWYTNVEGAAPHSAPWEIVEVPADYVRFADREPTPEEPAGAPSDEPWPEPPAPEADDELPF